MMFNLFIDHLNDLPGILDALHPVGIAAGIVDLPQRPFLKLSQMTVRQLALHADEPALVADDDVGDAGGAVRPSVFLPEENVPSQGRQVSLDGSDDVTLKQMNQLLFVGYGMKRSPESWPSQHSGGHPARPLCP